MLRQHDWRGSWSFFSNTPDGSSSIEIYYTCSIYMSLYVYRYTYVTCSAGWRTTCNRGVRGVYPSRHAPVHVIPILYYSLLVRGYSIRVEPCGCRVLEYPVATCRYWGQGVLLF